MDGLERYDGCGEFDANPAMESKTTAIRRTESAMAAEDAFENVLFFAPIPKVSINGFFVSDVGKNWIFVRV